MKKVNDMVYCNKCDKFVKEVYTICFPDCLSNGKAFEDVLLCEPCYKSGIGIISSWLIEVDVKKED